MEWIKCGEGARGRGGRVLWLGVRAATFVCFVLFVDPVFVEYYHMAEEFNKALIKTGI